jgi:hypothetical protein
MAKLVNREQQRIVTARLNYPVILNLFQDLATDKNIQFL